MRVLVTAFDPFGGETINPAWEAVSRLPRTIEIGTDVGTPACTSAEPIEVVTAQVPTIFREAIITAVHAIQETRPDAVICVGQAGGRRGITVERVAINIEDATLTDNAHVAPKDRPVTTDGPAAYFSTLPIKAIVAAIRSRGFDASVSNTAGTFVCNHLMYGVLHYLEQSGASAHPEWDPRAEKWNPRAETGVKAGFIHVPYAPEQSGLEPVMDTADVVRALTAAIVATVSPQPSGSE